MPWMAWRIMTDIFLAFDTSNYTTSVAAVDGDMTVLLNGKKLLPVAEGQRGLRQSDAVFHHTAAFEFVSEKIKELLRDHPAGIIWAVGSSSAPRDSEGSYMPCFTVGESLSSVAAAVLSVPHFTFSHQAGHVAAALLSSNSTDLFEKEFFAFHVSGGTTDILKVTGSGEGFSKIERIGGTLDLNAGQVIDRIGVLMGLKFPAGAEMEKLAASYSGKVPKYRSTVRGLDCNLSGIENKAAELFRRTKDAPLTSAFVIGAVTDALELLTQNLLESYPSSETVFAGGVMSCGAIKKRLSKYSSRFARPDLSSDNGVGCALLTKLRFGGNDVLR